MRSVPIYVLAAVLTFAAALSVAAAWFSVSAIENATRKAVTGILNENGKSWVEIHSDGMQIYMTGLAPSESERSEALSLARTVIDASQVVDQMTADADFMLTPPQFSIEIMHNDTGISLIGLLPASMDSAAFREEISEAAGGVPTTDLMSQADYPEPEGWVDMMAFISKVLKRIPHVKMTIKASRAEVIAIADNLEEKRQLESELLRIVPKDAELAIKITTPKQAISPFTLRARLDDDGLAFYSCSAGTESARDRILQTASKIGLNGDNHCNIGLGAPTPYWVNAVIQSINTLAVLGGGSLSFTDADISLEVSNSASRKKFDMAIGELKANLPEIFTLDAKFITLPDEGTAVKPEFEAILTREGNVHLDGDVGDIHARMMIESFAKSHFTSDIVHMSARIFEQLPDNWTMRIMTGIEALSHLSNGAVKIAETGISASGETGNRNARADISSLFETNLEDAAQYSLDIDYIEKLDPIESLPSLDECEQMIVLAQNQSKIRFNPGKSTLEPNGKAIMDNIADILLQCGEMRIEIGGHTDSQGTEPMNQRLSLQRAQSVLNELRKRKVLSKSITVKGYGENEPIADNATEEGREANRRIEFKFIRAEPLP